MLQMLYSYGISWIFHFVDKWTVCVGLFEDHMWQAPPCFDCTRSIWGFAVFLKITFLVAHFVCVWLSFLSRSWQFEYKDIFVGFSSVCHYAAVRSEWPQLSCPYFRLQFSLEGFAPASKVWGSFCFWCHLIWKIPPCFHFCLKPFAGTDWVSLHMESDWTKVRRAFEFSDLWKRLQLYSVLFQWQSNIQKSNQSSQQLS